MATALSYPDGPHGPRFIRRCNRCEPPVHFRPAYTVNAAEMSFRVGADPHAARSAPESPSRESARRKCLRSRSADQVRQQRGPASGWRCDARRARRTDASRVSVTAHATSRALLPHASRYTNPPPTHRRTRCLHRKQRRRYRERRSPTRRPDLGAETATHTPSSPHRIDPTGCKGLLQQPVCAKLWCWPPRRNRAECHHGRDLSRRTYIGSYPCFRLVAGRWGTMDRKS